MHCGPVIDVHSFCPGWRGGGWSRYASLHPRQLSQRPRRKVGINGTIRTVEGNGLNYFTGDGCLVMQRGTGWFCWSGFRRQRLQVHGLCWLDPHPQGGHELDHQ